MLSSNVTLSHLKSRAEINQPTLLTSSYGIILNWEVPEVHVTVWPSNQSHPTPTIAIFHYKDFCLQFHLDAGSHMLVSDMPCTSKDLS